MWVFHQLIVVEHSFPVFGIVHVVADGWLELLDRYSCGVKVLEYNKLGVVNLTILACQSDVNKLVRRFDLGF